MVETADALERWIDAQPPGELSVRRGAPQSAAAIKAVEKELGTKLPKAARAVIERFGWLEISVSPALWPHPMFVDGLRFLGIGDAPAALSLARQLELLRAVAAERTKKDPKAMFEFNRADSIAKSAPIVSTLEGLKNCWVARRDLVWFDDLTTAYEQSLIRLEADARNASPLASAKKLDALVPLLLARLDWRLERARALRSVLDALTSSLGACRVGGDQKIRAAARPDVAWSAGRHRGTLVVRAERALGFLDGEPRATAERAALVRVTTHDYDHDKARWRGLATVDQLGAPSIELAYGALDTVEKPIEPEPRPPSSTLAELVRRHLPTGRAELRGRGRLARVRIELEKDGMWGDGYGYLWRVAPSSTREKTLLVAELPTTGEATSELDRGLATLACFALPPGSDDERWLTA